LNWRRLSAKSASILLLRFFHGFYPSEIMQIGMLARKSVDNGLAQAREEVKAYLLDATCLQVVNRGAPPILAPLHIAIPAAEFEQELCDTIFQARSGDCLPPEVLRKRYTERTGISIECELLAHIVSCRKCLDLVCRWTNLPTYSHRSPYEASGLAQRDKGKRIPIAMPPKADPHVSMRTGQNRFREMYEHRPRVLMIAVDGEVLAARDVSSESCELKVEMNRGVPTELIEILSEQELPLLTVPISSLPPEAPPTICRKNTLDDGRKVELLVRFTPTGALLEVTYNDPQYAPVPPSVPGDHFTEPAPARAKWRAKRSDEEGGTSSLLRRCAKAVHELAKPSRHPIIAAAAAIAILLLVGSVIFKYSSARLRPDELLQRSVTAEYAPSPNLVGIVHQRIAITTPHRRLERNVYRDIKRHVHPRNKPLTSQDVGLEAALASADVSWNDPLSPATFEEWRNHETIARDIIKRDANHLVTLTTVAQSGTIAEESLTMRETDFHPVSRTVQFRDKDKIEMAELSYEILPWRDAQREWFEPTASAVSTGAAPRHLNLPASKIGVPLSDAELDEAELAVRLALNSLGADITQRLEIIRTNGGIQVKGVVPESSHKQELVSLISQIPHAAAVVRTFADLDSDPQNKPESIKVANLESQPSLLAQYLRVKNTPIDDAAQISHDIFESSVIIRRATHALVELDQKFQPSGLTLSAKESLRKLRDAERSHLLLGLSLQRGALLQTGISVSAPIRGVIKSDAELEGDADLNVKLCHELIAQASSDSEAAVILTEISKSLEHLEEAARQNSPAENPAPSSSLSSNAQDKK
jgi:hypothetical protein